MKNNKGELTTQQIVMIIILITSFAIILFFIFRLNLQETTDKEICHNSVIMKSQSVLGAGELDCKTSYVCISGGGECEEFNPSRTIEIDLNDAEKEITKAIAEEMADCWWMFGEGKVDYVGDWVNKPGFFETHKCAICSIIKFSNDLEISSFNYGDFEIDFNEKYSIITGMKDKNDFIEPLIVRSDEVSAKTTCKEFLTKA